LARLSDSPGTARLGSQAAAVITLPKVAPEVAPILYIIPVQLLTYHTAAAKGADVDQPPNRQERDGGVSLGAHHSSIAIFLGLDKDARLESRAPAKTAAGPEAGRWPSPSERRAPVVAPERRAAGHSVAERHICWRRPSRCAARSIRRLK
jgi:hypothetical protein